MLSISERCPALTDLCIPGVKKVSLIILWMRAVCVCVVLCEVPTTDCCVALAQISDVGLRYLSQGCPRLQNLDATGVFLITDGKTRDFGLEGLQVRSWLTG